MAPHRPDGVRRLFATASPVDKLLLFILEIRLTLQCVHGHVPDSLRGIGLEHRLTLWYLLRGLREQYPARVPYRFDRKTGTKRKLESSFFARRLLLWMRKQRQ